MKARLLKKTLAVPLALTFALGVSTPTTQAQIEPPNASDIFFEDLSNLGVDDLVFFHSNNEVLSGKDVLSVIKKLKGHPYAVLIENPKLNSGKKLSKNRQPYIVSSNPYKKKGSKDFINYNVILSTDHEGSLPYKLENGYHKKNEIVGSNIVSFYGRSYKTSTGYSVVENALVWDKTNISKLKSTDIEYINPKSLYKSYLLQDTHGNVLGVVFEDTGKKIEACRYC